MPIKFSLPSATVYVTLAYIRHLWLVNHPFTCRMTLHISATSSECTASASRRLGAVRPPPSTLQKTTVTGGIHRPAGKRSARPSGENEEPALTNSGRARRDMSVICPVSLEVGVGCHSVPTDIRVAALRKQHSPTATHLGRQSREHGAVASRARAPIGCQRCGPERAGKERSPDGQGQGAEARKYISMQSIGIGTAAHTHTHTHTHTHLVELQQLRPRQQ